MTVTAISPSMGSNQESVTYASNSSKGHSIGRRFKNLKTGIADVGLKIKKGCGKAIDAAAAVTTDSDAITHLLNASHSLLLGIGHAAKKEQHVTQGVNELKTAVNVVEFFQTIGLINYFVKKAYKDPATNKVKKFEFTKNLSLLTAGVGGAILWFHELKWIDFGKNAAKIGKIGGQVVGGIAGFAYLVQGAHAIHTLCRSKDAKERKQAWIDLAWSVAEVGLRVLVVAAISNIPALVILGVLAGALGVTSFLHHQLKKESPMEDVKKAKPAAV